MYCSGNSGFIEIVGPLETTLINTIKQDKSPVSINVAPRKIVPTLTGNRIEESTGTTETTCRDLNNNIYTLIDIQICSVTHKGFNKLRKTPSAELIISFKAKKESSTGSSAVLLCISIYDSGYESHAEYLNQLIERDSDAATLTSIFASSPEDKTQTSFGYKTCFETVDKETVELKNLYVVVFPNGIHVTHRNYQKLISRIGKLKPYRVPPAIRDGDYTINSYKINQQGNKYEISKSNKGNIYSTTISSVSSEFKNNIIYFTLPPNNSSGSKSEKCTYYDTTQYKCVPFNKLKDVSNGIVIPGNTSLASIIDENDSSESIEPEEMDTEQIMVAVIIIMSLSVVGVVGYKIVQNYF